MLHVAPQAEHNSEHDCPDLSGTGCAIPFNQRGQGPKPRVGFYDAAEVPQFLAYLKGLILYVLDLEDSLLTTFLEVMF